MSLQQIWLRDQSELVRLTRERDELTTNVKNTKKELTILAQKKIHIESKEIIFNKCLREIVTTFCYFKEFY